MSDDRRRWAVVGAVVAALVAAIALVVWSSGRDGDSTPESSGVPEVSSSPGPDEEADDSTAEPEGQAPTETEVPEVPPPPVDGEPLPDPVVVPPVPLDEPAEFGTGASARLVEVEPIEAEGDGPGEVSGPALRLTVELDNGATDPIDLSRVVVDLFHGLELTPGEPLAGNGTSWLEGTLEPGETATGVYAYSVPADSRDLVHVRVSYDPAEPTVLFEGPVRSES